MFEFYPPGQQFVFFCFFFFLKGYVIMALSTLGSATGLKLGPTRAYP